MDELEVVSTAIKQGGPWVGGILAGLGIREYFLRLEQKRANDIAVQVELLRKREYDRIVAENDRLTRKHDEFYDAYTAAAIEAQKSRDGIR